MKSWYSPVWPAKIKRLHGLDTNQCDQKIGCVLMHDHSTDICYETTSTLATTIHGIRKDPGQITQTATSSLLGRLITQPVLGTRRIYNPNASQRTAMVSKLGRGKIYGPPMDTPAVQA